MALAEQQLAHAFNRPGHTIVDHWTYVFMGDGCMMEGISHEACSFAGTQGLEKLVAFYDDNGISIDGHVEGWFRDDTAKRFESYGWRVITGVDGHDSEAVAAAVAEAKNPAGKPTLVMCRTVIGWGAPKLAGTHDSHGAPLGATEVVATREALGWDYPPFEVPSDLRATWDARAIGAQRQAEWDAEFTAYAKAFPAEAAEFRRRVRHAAGGFRRQGGCGDRCGGGGGRSGRYAEILAERDQRVRAVHARIPRRLSGSDRVEPDQLEGLRQHRARPARQLPALRRAGVRHVGDHERDRAARRIPAVRRHLPGVRRLCPQRHPAVGTDGAADDLRADA